MSKAIEKLHAAQQQAMAIRANVGGFPYPSKSDIGQRSFRVHVGRDADFPPPLGFLCPRGFGLAGVLNGIAAEQKMRREMFAVNQTQDSGHSLSLLQVRTGRSPRGHTAKQYDEKAVTSQITPYEKR